MFSCWTTSCSLSGRQLIWFLFFLCVISTSSTLYYNHFMMLCPPSNNKVGLSFSCNRLFFVALFYLGVGERGTFKRSASQSNGGHSSECGLNSALRPVSICMFLEEEKKKEKQNPAEALGATAEVLVLPGDPEAISIPVTCCTTECMLAGCRQRQRPPTRCHTTPPMHKGERA